MIRLTWIVLVLVLGTSGGDVDVENLPEAQNNLGDTPVGICQGRKTPVRKLPFMASLKVNGGVFGAAVVVGDYYLLTSAFNVKWWQPSALEFRVKSQQYETGGQVLTADQVICHDLYNGGWDYNIALIRTNEKIKAKTVKLGSEELPAETVATIAGWGSTDPSSSKPSQFLLSASVTVLDWDLCNETYSPQLTSRMTCTKYEDAGPCGGDFGDPLLYNNTIYGFYSGKLNSSSPRIYTNVAAFADWIQSIVN